MTQSGENSVNFENSQKIEKISYRSPKSFRQSDQKEKKAGFVLTKSKLRGYEYFNLLKPPYNVDLSTSTPDEGILWTHGDEDSDSNQNVIKR